MVDGNCEQVEVAIIGAGPAGIGVAAGLSRLRINSLLIDRSTQPGGIPASYSVKKSGVPTFVNYRRGQIIYGIELVQGLLGKLKETSTRLYLQSSVVGIDRSQKMIHLVNSELGIFAVKADAIVFATGARERTAAERGWVAGVRGARVWHTLDILRLVDRLGKLPGRHPAVIGSDLIAYATAAKLKTAGAEAVIMIDTTAAPRASLLSRLYFSRWVRPHWFGSAERAELIGNGHPSSIHLDHDRTVACDMVVLSGDLVPNSELLLTAGLPVDSPGGIPVVLDGCRLSQEGWFVAGGILGGFHGAYSCYRNGRRVAKYVARYLKANCPAKSQAKSG